MLFQQYTASSFKNINKPYLIKEWKTNMDNEAYEYNPQQDIVKHFLEIELNRSMNGDYCTEIILQIILCF